MAERTGAKGKSASRGGTRGRVADALVDCYRLGISTVRIRGVDPLPDGDEYGRDLIPLVRERSAREDARNATHAA